MNVTITPTLLHGAVTPPPSKSQAHRLLLAAALADGTSILTESVWDNRFRYIEELRRMGAQASVDGKIAVFEGVPELSGAQVRATDLRAGAAMIIAGLAAHGETQIEDIGYIDRGYEKVVEKFSALGADIRRVTVPEATGIPVAL